jgi:hypothetical protein
MKTNIEKSRLRRLYSQGFSITQCARKCKMDRKTAAGILHCHLALETVPSVCASNGTIFVSGSIQLETGTV